MTKLKKLRCQYNISCGDMAKVLNISKTHYWQIEKKQRKLYYDVAIKISSVFKIKPDDLFYEDYKR